MHPSIEKLLRVQDVDSQILFLREAIRVRPQELEDERQKVLRANEAVQSLEGRIKKARMAADQRELDVKKFDEDVGKLKVALNTSKSNAEYSVIRDQIEKQSELRGVAEEDVLVSLSEIDALETELKEIVVQQQAIDKSFGRRKHEMDELIQGIELQVAELEKDRAEKVAGIDVEHLRMYQRVLDRHRNYALAQTEDGICRGCNMRVTPQNVNLLMLNEIVVCTQCARFLYLAD